MTEPEATLPKLVEYALQDTPYEIHTFPTTIRDAQLVAQHFGVPPEQVYKTLVATRAKGKPVLAVIAANQQLNLKKLARALGEKKLVMATHKEAEKITQLQVGGISALALLHKNLTIVLDELAQLHATIYVSGGQRGLDVKMTPQAFIDIVQPLLLDVADFV